MIVKDMDQAQEAVKKLLNSSEKILVAGEPSADWATLLAMLALKNILDGAGKKTILWPECGAGFKDKFEKIIPKSDGFEALQKIKIKIPKSAQLEELKYEEENDFFSIIISPKSALEPSAVSIEKSPHEMDAAFCFFADVDGWKKITAPIERPPAEKTVYVSGGEKTAAEKISGIHEIINDSRPMPQSTATLLLASLIYETDNFQKQNNGIFGLADTLIGAGADRKAVEEITLADKKIEAAQILGRALARTTAEEELKTSWTFLTKNDFQKTGFAPSKENALLILRKARSNIIPTPCSVLCYENGEEVEALVYHEDKNVLGSLALVLGAIPQSPYFFASGFKNFSEAETKIRNLLKEKISAKIGM